MVPSLAWLIAARAAQGVAAAILTPSSLALIGATFPKQTRGRAARSGEINEAEPRDIALWCDGAMSGKAFNCFCPCQLEMRSIMSTPRRCRLIVPYADSAPLSAKLLQNGTLKTYKGFPHGMPTTDADTINADLLTFFKA